jgi:hypothetical protein
VMIGVPQVATAAGDSLLAIALSNFGYFAMAWYFTSWIMSGCAQQSLRCLKYFFVQA